MTRTWFKVQSIVLALLFGVSVFLPGARHAKADSFGTDSWDCTWGGATWFNGSLGWGGTSGDLACTVAAAVELHYYSGGTWGSSGWQSNSTYWIQSGYSPCTSIWAYHWINVNGHGWGQSGYSQEG